LLSERLPLSGDAQSLQLTRVGDEVQVDFSEHGVAHRERYDLLLAATGRRPNLAGLKLEASGVRLDDRGLPSFDPHTGQIEQSHLFIAGDVTATRALLHEAADLGRIAGDNAGRYPDLRRHPRSAALGIAFSDPQMALAGRSYRELQQAGVGFAIGAVDFAKQGRSRVAGVNAGMLRVYGERDSGRFLGAEMIGPAAEHIGHLLAWAVQQQVTVQQMLDSPFYHPVIEEGVRTALRELLRELQMGPKPVAHCMDCGPGA
jgi:dihydrolipoamide dehydrogenase